MAGTAAGLLCAAALAAGRPAAAEPPPFPSMEPPPALTPRDSGTPGAAEGGATPTPAPSKTAPPVRLGDFDFPYGAVPQQPSGPPERGWTIVPGIGLDLIGTDNVRQTHSNRRADFITAITPSLLVTADTARFTGIVGYAPSLRLYADDTDQNRVEQRFNAQMLATLIPETLYFDLRGYGALQSATGGFAPERSAGLDRRNQVQTYSIQASPYLIHRFGGLATLQIGYAFQYVSQDATSGFSSATNPAFAPQEFTAHEGYAVLRTGEDLGRLAFEGRLIGTVYDGTGVLDGAHRYAGTLEARYAITRSIAVLVEGGYEDLRYAGVPETRIQDAIWAVGVRFAPAPDTVIIAKYGHRDGFESAYLDATVALGSGLRLSASYAELLSTSALRAADLLSTTTLDERGNPVNAATGAPTVLSFADSLLGVQSSLMRIKRGTASLSQAWPRDTLTLSVLYEDRRPVAEVPGTVAFAQRGTSVSLTWSHELAPQTSAIAYAQYGRTESRTAGVGDSDVYTFSATLVHRFTPNLVGSMQYIFNRRQGDVAANSYTENMIIAGLRQTF